MRLISVDELKEWIKNWFDVNRNYHPYSKQNNIPIPELYDILERMPTIERKTGKWMHDKDDVLYSGYCSCCGWESVIGETDVADMSYCPNCGSEMR